MNKMNVDQVFQVPGLTLKIFAFIGANQHNWSLLSLTCKLLRSVLLKKQALALFDIHPSHGSVTSTGGEILQHLPVNSVRLNLYYASFSLDDKFTKHLNRLVHVHSLSLHNSTVTDKGLKNILQNMADLRSLNLENCSNITDQGLWAALSDVSRLLSLNLSFCDQITNQGLKALQKVSDLQSLSLVRCNQITDHGLQKALRFLGRLQSLDLSDCRRITGLCFQGLTQNSSCLQNLDLSRCENLAREGFWALKEIKSLQKLNLSGCEITDEDLYMLRALSGLQSLDLSCCYNITNEGLAVALQPLSDLRNLDLSHCWRLKLTNSQSINAKRDL